MNKVLSALVGACLATTLYTATASAVSCTPPGGLSTQFNPIDPASVTQIILNTGRFGAGAPACQVKIGVNDGAPQVFVGGSLTDASQSVIGGE
jgi:hypothetical protein